MRTVLDSLTTPSSILAICILLFSVFLLICRKRLHTVLWRVLCYIPLLACVIHALVYYLGKQESVALTWFGPMYLTALLIALWPLVKCRKIIYRIIAGIGVALSVFNSIYIPAGTSLPTHLHNYTYQDWTDSFISTVRAMEKEYPISDWKGLDYDALLEEFVPRIQEAERNQDLNAFGIALYDYCNRFYDGHVYSVPLNTEMVDDMNRELLGNDYDLSLITLDNGEVVAVHVESDSEAAVNGIRTGTVITHWDGVPVNEAKYSFTFPIKPPVKENEEPTRTMMLAAQGGDTVSVTFVADDGAEKTVLLHRIGDYVSRFAEVYYNRFSHGVEADENYSYKMISDTCGYLRIHSESLPVFELVYSQVMCEAPFIADRVDEILGELQAKGMTNLVIDIRNNTGGQPEVPTAIASLFAEDSFTYGWQNCTTDENGEIHKYDPLVVRRNGKWKDLPVVVLVNQRTVSGGDEMSDLLSSFPNVTLMGMTPSNCSCQATGGVSYLADGLFVIYYPVVLNLTDANNDPLIDTDASRETRIPLEVRIPITEKAVKEMFGEEQLDYELEYAVDWLSNHH